jgi:mannonate dehydratase
VKRRTVITGLAAAGLAVPAVRYWPDDGFRNPCPGGGLPDSLRDAPRVTAALAGLDMQSVWDCHVHLIGAGDGGHGIQVHPELRDPAHPLRYLQYRFYLNAACAPDNGVDDAYQRQLLALQAELPPGMRLMLLTFDRYYDETGEVRDDLTTFHTPNALAAGLAHAYPERFEWIASIHPYRDDCVAALDAAVAQGARAIKWLPPGMGMDPASPLCDRFYAALVRHDLPLLVHGGDEYAVLAGGTQHLGNPLRLRRALDQGVRVIVAHCASIGSNIDLDAGEDGPSVHNFDLFARLMDEPGYAGRLFGEISALTQINRTDRVLRTVVQRDDWHHRLVNGSDYPLPGVMPVFSVRGFVRRGYLDETQARTLIEVRRYNPVLFDLLLKRMLRIDGKGFDARVFESRRLFVQAQA